MKSDNTLITQPSNPSESPIAFNESSAVGIILAVAILIGAIAKLIQVLVPVMVKEQNRQ